MSRLPKQPKPTLRDRFKTKWHKLTSKVKHRWNKLTRKRSPAHATQPSPSTTAPSNSQGPPPTPTPPPNPGCSPSPVDNGEDSMKGANTDTSDPAQSQPDFDYKVWKIDGDTVSQFLQWGEARGNEKSKWTELIEKFDGALGSETLAAVTEFIPDGPLPVKTLVNALLSIVKLGIEIAGIRQKVYEFALQTIEDIRDIVEASGDSLAAKKSLEDICTVVNEICEWANKLVRGNVWKGALHNELGDWSSKLEQAKRKLVDRTVLTTNRTVQRMNSNLATKDLIQKKQADIEKKLAEHLATNYSCTDQKKSVCVASTRVAILEDIMQWLSPRHSSPEHICWITGVPGSGKSTLSATIVDKLRREERSVAAQFFISRNILETTDPDKLIPTIAKQLSEFSPAAAHIIHHALKDGFISPRKEQVEKLLLAPIKELSRCCDMVIILIDALDELQNPADSVREILSPVTTSGLPDNVRFVITSRPEHWTRISETLNHAGLKRCPLETKHSVKEVHDFIVARMKDITPEDWVGWPSDGQLLELSKKADGLFHYAATALQWIKEQIQQYNEACQSWVFEQLPQMGGLGDLDNLYRLILTSFEDKIHMALRGDQLGGFREVIGTILVLHQPLTIHQITALLAYIPKDKFDVAHFLRRFSSVLIPGTTAAFEEATPQIHKSFRDYIMNAAPDGFRILTGPAHFITARSCLEVIVKAGSQSDVVVSYSVEHWYRHLREAVEEGVRFEDERMWGLLGQMMGDAAVNVWKAKSWSVFVDVAAVGWKLLQKDTDEHKMKGISDIVMKAKDFTLAEFRETEIATTLPIEFAFIEEKIATQFARTFETFLEETGIPYSGIWNDSLLETWKHHSSTSPEGPHSVSGNPTPKYS